MKYIFLGLYFSFAAMAEEAQEGVAHKEFVATPFGIKSRTIDFKDAEKVLKAIEDYKISHPTSVVTGIDILTCTSDYELPQNTVTNKKVDEHLALARDRHVMLTEQIIKSTKLPVTGEYKICGPEYKKEDLNDRFVTIQSGAIYDERFKVLIQSDGFAQKLKEEALIDEPESLKKLYPSPFLAKFKPFQGVRIFIKGKQKEKGEAKIKSAKPPSGKIQ